MAWSFVSRRCLSGLILNRQSVIGNGQFDWFAIDFPNEAGNSHAVTTNRILPMAQTIFHASIEGAQHGAKNLSQFLDYAKKSGAAGAQTPIAAAAVGGDARVARAAK